MKSKIALALLALAGASQAAVTIGFSTGTNVAEGWANSSGSQNSAMVWGMIVDVDGDGFDGFASATSTISDGGLLYTAGATYDPGFVRTGTSGTGAIAGGQALTILGGTATDDRIFLSTNLMALVSSQARMTQLASMTYGTGMAAGDKYALVWFDYTSLGGAATAQGDKYGAWTKSGASVTTGTILPADPGSYTTATGPAGLFGADNTASSKTASLTLYGVPEPSAALLGALGALGLLRRRRI